MFTKGLLLSLVVVAGGIQQGFGVGLRNHQQVALQAELASFERELASGFTTNFTECMPTVQDYQTCEGFNAMANQTVSCVAEVLGLEGESYDVYVKNYCILMSKYELLLPQDCEVSICEGQNSGGVDSGAPGVFIGNCSISLDAEFSSCDDVNELVDSLLDCLENMTAISEDEWGQYVDTFCTTFEEFSDMFPESCPIEFCSANNETLGSGFNGTESNSTDYNSTDYMIDQTNTTETNTTETEDHNIDLDCNLPNDLNITSCADVNSAISSLYSCYESFELNATMLEAYKDALCEDLDQYEIANLPSGCVIEVCSNSTNSTAY